ncbi:hypothetical protein GWI33_019692 [Rhynchophorus ferrugineus]|uniref:Uncharacterized protein n=1 Tax=Rhynchophorus ferrugineus TaxID=354439 RepID=A0A834HTW3_RHYFE|nr:hypothetical protein GWI33_019692 [Rhynchophorus ferrugineus]
MKQRLIISISRPPPRQTVRNSVHNAAEVQAPLYRASLGPLKIKRKKQRARRTTPPRQTKGSSGGRQLSSRALRRLSTRICNSWYTCVEWRARRTHSLVSFVSPVGIDEGVEVLPHARSVT